MTRHYGHPRPTGATQRILDDNSKAALADLLSTEFIVTEGEPGEEETTVIHCSLYELALRARGQGTGGFSFSEAMPLRSTKRREMRIHVRSSDAPMAHMREDDDKG